MQDLGTLGGTNSEALAINDAGQATGDAGAAGGVGQHAFLWNPSPAPHVPSMPSGLTATPANGSVVLSWQSNLAADGVTHYNVYRTDQWFSGPWATSPGTTFTNASSVINGTRYCYQVSATNSRGEGAKTAPVCATPTGPPAPVPSMPSGLTTTPANGSVALSWQPTPPPTGSRTTASTAPIRPSVGRGRPQPGRHSRMPRTSSTAPSIAMRSARPTQRGKARRARRSAPHPPGRQHRCRRRRGG